MRYIAKRTKALKMIQQVIPVDPKELKIRSKVELFKGIDKNKFTAIIGVKQKSRILTKDIQKFEDIVEKMGQYFAHTFHVKQLIVDAPMCSKARKAMQDSGWIVVDATV
jgi:hypothetical protein